MKIFIPSINRASLQKTYNNLTTKLRKDSFIVVPTQQVSMYEVYCPLATVIGTEVKGIALTRDFILEFAIKNNFNKIVMLDDDLQFQKRRDDMRITNSSEAEVEEAFEWLNTSLDEYAHSGFAVRFNAFADPKEHLSPGRMMHVLGYNMETVKKESVRFSNNVDDDHVMDDFNMTLQLLCKGYNNKVSLVYRTSPSQANSKGGASEWRTVEIINRSVSNMQKNFSDFIKVREKKNWSGIVGEQQLDITANWKKAYEFGRQKCTR